MCLKFSKSSSAVLPLDMSRFRMHQCSQWEVRVQNTPMKKILISHIPWLMWIVTYLDYSMTCSKRPHKMLRKRYCSVSSEVKNNADVSWRERYSWMASEETKVLIPERPSAPPFCQAYSSPENHRREMYFLFNFNCNWFFNIFRLNLHFASNYLIFSCEVDFHCLRLFWWMESLWCLCELTARASAGFISVVIFCVWCRC